MRLRTLLVATAAGATLLAGLSGTTAQADPVPPWDGAGTMVGWGTTSDPTTAAALTVPAALPAAIADVATDARATAVVTADGHLRVWGAPGAVEVEEAPTGVTDATAVAISPHGGLVLHADGTVTGWGSAALEDVPDDLTKVQAIAVGGAGTGYAVALPAGGGEGPGPLVVWGADPVAGPAPEEAAYATDVSANAHQTMVLYGNRAIVWSDSAALDHTPDFGRLRVTQIATSATTNGVVLSDGSVRLWGDSVPAGQPDLTGQKVISLSLGTNAGAVTDDGVAHVWGAQADVNAVPAALAGQPVSALAMGDKHAFAVLAFRALARPKVTGTPEVGQTLTATPATFTLAPTGSSPATGQWYDGVTPIAGQTATTLAVGDYLTGAVLSYRSSQTRAGLTVTSASTPVGPIAPASSTVTLRVSPASASAGATRTATATVSRPGGTASGRITFTLGDRSRIAIMSAGKATWSLPDLPVGHHQVTAVYSGSPSTVPSTATPVDVTVRKAASRVAVKAHARGTKATLTLQVRRPKSLFADGRVRVTLRGRTTTTVRARVAANGSATVTVELPRPGAHGTYTATVTYAGNANLSASRRTVRFTARAAGPRAAARVVLRPEAPNTCDARRNFPVHLAEISSC